MKRMRILVRKRGILALVSWLMTSHLLLGGLPAWSQDSPTNIKAPEQAEMRVMVMVTGSGAASDIQSLAIALSESPRLDIVFIAPIGEDTITAASRSQCQLAVIVSSQNLPPSEARSSWAVLDSLSRNTLAEGVIEGPEPTAIDLLEFWWLPIVAAVETASPSASSSRILVEGAEGTRITGLGDGEHVLPSSGILELELLLPGVYRWRAVSKGSYPETGAFAFMRAGDTLTIPRRSLHSWSIELGSMMAQFPDVWASWRFANDWLFVRAGFSQYLLGLYLVDERYGKDTPSALLSLPMVQPGLGLGAYMLPSDSLIRPYASASAFIRLSAPGSERWSIDPIAPMCLLGVLGAEWRFSFRVAAFFELGGTYYPFANGPLLVASKEVDVSDTWKPDYGEGWFLDMPTMRLGIRVYL